MLCLSVPNLLRQLQNTNMSTTKLWQKNLHLLKIYCQVEYLHHNFTWKFINKCLNPTPCIHVPAH